MTTTRRTCGSASKRWAKDRMEAHDVQAKNTARAKSTAKVNRQSSFCRFSNLSNCAEITERELAPGEELPVVPREPWFSSSIRVGRTPFHQEVSPLTTSTSYCRNFDRISATKPVTGNS